MNLRGWSWLIFFGGLAVGCAAAPAVVDLRVDGRTAPLGLDDAQPSLSWRLESATRGARQTGCRVLVATSAEALDQERGDLWDSGRREAAESIGLSYAGAALRGWQRIFWKVKIWDEHDAASAWSETGTWTVGALSATDWSSSARWISDPALLHWERKKLGYRSQSTKDVNAAKWIALDFGEARTVERVRLHGVAHTVTQNLGFPRRYRLEAANRADFSDARVVAELTDRDANPWVGLIDLPLTNAKGRYLRVTATKLRAIDGEACLALSQIETISGGSNIAPKAHVTASDSREDESWSLAAVNDGLGVPGANARASDTLRLRRVFTVRPGLRRALFAVSGLGQAVLSVNGAELDAERLLTPGWTDDRKTCLYDTHDLTTALREGANALGLTLAGGMYNVQGGFGRYGKFVSAYRPLKAWGELRLEYADGSTDIVGTDESWRVAPGPVTYANIFGGEDYDARKDDHGWTRTEFDDSAWTPAATTNGPGGVLRGAAWSSPPLIAHESLPPTSVREIRPGVSVYDFGQNAAMMPRLRVHGPVGATVRLIPAELVKADGTVSRGSSGGGLACWSYVLRGDAGGENWFPSFFYHGARYLQVEASAPPGGARAVVDELDSVVVHSDSPAAGTFACSNELFNRIHALVRWAQRSNLAHVLTDCPHRERLGWLEQYHLNGPALRYEWDVTQLFAKGFDDMEDAQRTNGLIPDIAPEYVVFDGGFVDSPEWGSALILAAWQHHVFTGDVTPLRKHYEAMRRYFDYLTSRADGRILSHGLGDWYDLGPKAPGVAQLTPIALTATAIYYEDATVLAKIAKRLGRRDDAAAYEATAAEIGSAFNARFFDAANGHYSTGSQTAQAMPLALGMVPQAAREKVVAALLHDIAAHDGGGTAGDVGYRYLLRALAETGHSAVIFAMNNRSDRPGYGYQLAHGATALTEAWDANPRSSQNHFMLGQIMEWFYQDVAGLGVDPTAPGFRNTIVRPQPVGDLTWAEATHRSPFGEVAVRWKRDGGHFRLEVSVPPNATATVFVPVRESGTVREGGRPGAKTAEITFLRREADRDVFAVASGNYTFEAEWP